MVRRPNARRIELDEKQSAKMYPASIPSIIRVPPEPAVERIPLGAMCDGPDSGTICPHTVDRNRWRGSVRSKDDFFTNDNREGIQAAERQLFDVRAICIHHEKL